MVLGLPVPVANLATAAAASLPRAGDINAWTVEASGRVSVPFVDGTDACGFPSPADDYQDRLLD
jgi:DNA polymerase V